MSEFATATSSFTESLETGEHVFSVTLAFVETWFEFTPTAFENGSLQNGVDENQGSARVFALGNELGLTDKQTLLCFGEHYRDVLDQPDGDSHGNIRNFMKTGANGVSFDKFPLVKR
jgi:hypothetical protein